MNRDRIEAAAAEARRFLDRVKAWKESSTVVVIPATEAYPAIKYDNSSPVDSGALRRASMDLTRSLAAMRKPS